MKKLIKSIKMQFLAFLTPEPEIQEDYVDKVVYLLRRDFDSKSQNEIILSITQKLGALREQDIVVMEQEMKILKENTSLLRQRISLTPLSV